MTSLTQRLRPLLCASLLAPFLMAPLAASAQNYDASLERGARPDTTPQQRYQTAIREAGGRFEALAGRLPDAGGCAAQIL